jgi:hypothetical protein
MRRTLLAELAAFAPLAATAQTDSGELFNRFLVQEVAGVSDASAESGGVNPEGNIAVTLSGPSAKYWSEP